MTPNDARPTVASYFKIIDGKNVIQDRFVSRQAVEPLVMQLGKDGLVPNQLQRFFRHCRKLDLQLRRKEKTWNEVRTSILMLPAHAANGMQRPRDPIPKSFVEFITGNVDMIRTEEDFRNGFMRHFEVVLGYAPKYLRRREH